MTQVVQLINRLFYRQDKEKIKRMLSNLNNA